MITLEHVYVFAGLVFAGFAFLGARDVEHPRRYWNAAFWAVFALSFLIGSLIGDSANGALALVLAVLGGLGRLGRSRRTGAEQAQRLASARRHGNTLFIPALIIPATALIGTFFLKHATIAGLPLVDGKQATIISLALGVLVAWLVAVLWLRPPVLTPLDEGRRLMDSVGWAAILPQMLAALGAVFALAGVGRTVGTLATEYIPLTHPLAAVAVYCGGMALFTAVMGNAFAAFPVMTAAIGLPLIVHKFGGNPAIMSAIGMLSGFCGTLVTPMAANFNIVPAALLELPTATPSFKRADADRCPASARQHAPDVSACFPFLARLMQHDTDRRLASRFARTALGHVSREWPNKLDHVMGGPEDVQRPRALHPIFFGSFDWHSCVHGWWLLARLYRGFLELPEHEAIRATFRRAADGGKCFGRGCIPCAARQPRVRTAVRLGVGAHAGRRTRAARKYRRKKVVARIAAAYRSLREEVRAVVCRSPAIPFAPASMATRLSRSCSPSISPVRREMPVSPQH